MAMEIFSTALLLCLVLDPVGNIPAFLAVLREMKAIGFEGFETSFRNVQAQYADPAPARASLAASGLAFFGVHIFLTEYDARTRVAPMDLVKATADGAAALGAQRVILSGAGLVRDGTVADGDLALKVAGLHEAARYCRDRGLAFAYHNHGQEFAPAPEGTLFDVFSAEGILLFSTRIESNLTFRPVFKNGCCYALRLDGKGFPQAVRWRLR